jgi:hypothetical protein
MRRSSATQLELDLIVDRVADTSFAPPVGPGIGSRESSAPTPPSPSVNDISSSSSAPFRIPNAGVDQEVYAVTARQASRLNASAISEQERAHLLREREALLDKQYSGGLTRSQTMRLRYVRWTLDRIDDAVYGEALDDLERSVDKYEQFLSDLQGLRDQLDKKQHTDAKNRGNHR